LSSPRAKRIPCRNFANKPSDTPGLDWRKYVEIDKVYYPPPAEVDVLIGDASKARKVLGWQPRTRFKDLVSLMVDADIKMLEDQLSGRVPKVDVGQH
jgi:GDPmannose 4,6-dehydratase